MPRSAPSSGDVLVLRDILDLADTVHTAPSTTVVTEILRRLEGLLGSDGVMFHAMDSKDFSYRHVQGVFAGEPEVFSGDGCTDDDVFVTEGMEVLHDHWWVSPCSIIERTGAPVATSIRSWYGERRWAEHPVHREYIPYVDELIFGYPDGGVKTLRILAGRESGPSFGERELTICRLLLPHLHDVLAAVVTPSQPTARLLTARQEEILHLTEIGMSNQQIGAALGISATTVRTHLEHIFARLGVATRTAAVTAAFGSPSGVQRPPAEVPRASA